MYGERDYFERGKQLLGKSAGGLLTRVLKAKGGNVSLAMRTLELAAEKQDPREWFAAAAAGPKQSDMFSPASVHARQEAARKQIAERDKQRPHSEADKAKVAEAAAKLKAYMAQVQSDHDARMASAIQLGDLADRLHGQTLEEKIDDWDTWP